VDHERPRLRAVLIAARAHAPCERVPSGDELAELVIDMAGELTARDRAVLAGRRQLWAVLRRRTKLRA